MIIWSEDQRRKTGVFRAMCPAEKSLIFLSFASSVFSVVINKNHLKMLNVRTVKNTTEHTECTEINGLRPFLDLLY